MPGELPGELPVTGIAVREVMLDRPKLSAADASVAQVRDVLRDDHVHVALLVDDGGVLVAVVDAADLDGAAADDPAAPRGALGDRVVAPEADLGRVRDEMSRTARRRLAVVEPDGRLVGLLALKRSGRGFCSAHDVAARAAED